MIGGHGPEILGPFTDLTYLLILFGIWILVVILSTQIRHHITPLRFGVTIPERFWKIKKNTWKKAPFPSSSSQSTGKKKNIPPFLKNCQKRQSSMEIDLKTKAARTASTFRMLTNLRLREVWKPNRSTCPSVIFPQLSKAICYLGMWPGSPCAGFVHHPLQKYCTIPNNKSYNCIC